MEIKMPSGAFAGLIKVLAAKGYSTSVGDEGGFAPSLKSNEEALEVVTAAIKKAGYKPGKDISIALDPAATEMFDNKTKSYKFFKSAPKKKVSSDAMVKHWAGWDDWLGFRFFCFFRRRL